MRGTGFLAIWSDVADDHLVDYLHWLTREHTTERVTTRGFLACRVFRAARGDLNRFFILYELDSPEVLDGEAYLAHLNAPTPWSQRVMPRLGNFSRGGGSILARAGRGEGASIIAQRLDRPADDAAGLAQAVAACDGVAAVQVGATDQVRTAVPTVEKRMRKDEGFFAGLLMVEAVDQASARLGWEKAAGMLSEGTGPVGNPEIYQAIFALDRRIADLGS